MSFEPKIYTSDDPAPQGVSPERKSLGEPAAPLWDDAEQLELPADLAMLAEQLRDDANYLAQRHPADATPEQRAIAFQDTQRMKMMPSARRHPLRWWIAGAAAVFIGAGWLGWQLSRQNHNRPDSVAVATSPRGQANEGANEAIIVAPALATDTEITTSDKPKGPRIQRLPDEGPRLVPASFLRDVSGPELDAMLDLMAEQTDTGLSI